MSVRERDSWFRHVNFLFTATKESDDDDDDDDDDDCVASVEETETERKTGKLEKRGV